MSKSNIRREIIEKRKDMSKCVVDNKSNSIMANLSKIDEFNSADNILCYSSINNEVNTKSMLNLCLKKNIFLPKVQKNNELSIHLISCLDQLHPGSFGVLEPDTPPIDDISIIELAIIPLVVFDNALHRIGYGGGYYDRLLSQIDCCKIGLAYDFQRIDKIINEEHDIQLDIIITEKNIYLPK